MAMAPKTSPRPKARPRSKLAPKTSPRPKAAPMGPNYDPKYIEKRSTQAMAKGGMAKEGSAEDMREDKAMAKKRGMTMKQWEASSADVKHDKPMKMKTGGGVMRGTGAATRGKKFSGSF